MNKDDIFRFLSQQFAIDTKTIALDTGLFSEGFLDSFSITDLIIFLESHASIQIAPDEVTLDNLDSVHKIIAFTKSKIAIANNEPGCE